MASPARAQRRRTTRSTSKAPSKNNGNSERTEKPDQPVLDGGVVESSDGEKIEHPSVLVVRVPTEEGFSFRIVPVNGMDVMAIPTVLESAYKMSRNQLGLGN